MNEQLTPAQRILIGEGVLVDHSDLFKNCCMTLHRFMQKSGSAPKFLIVGSLAFEAIAYRYVGVSSYNRITTLTTAAFFGSQYRECQLVVDPNLPPDHISAVGTPLQSIQEIVARQA